MSKKNLYLLSLTSFLNDVGGELLNALLPYFLIGLGFSSSLIGFTAGLREAIAYSSRLLGGWLGNKIKAKPLITAGYTLSSVSKALLLLPLTKLSALVILALERLGKGLREPARDRLLSSISSKRGEVFGFHRALDTAGAIVGALIAFLLFERFPLTLLLGLAAFFSLLAVVPVLFIEDKLKPSQATLSAKLKGFLKPALLFAFAHVSYMFLMLQAGKEGLLLYFLFNILYAGLAYPLGKAADRVGKKRLLALGYITFALSLALAIPNILIAFLLYGIAYAAIESNQRAIIAELSGDAGGIGLALSLIGIAMLIGNTAFGFLYSISPPLAFSFFALLSAISGAWLIRG